MAIDPILTESYFKPVTNAATGRVAFEIQAGAGKTTVEAGNTGVRDVSGLFTAGNVASGRVLVQRAGNTVTWTLVGLNLAGTVSSVWSILANTGGRFDGFRPIYTAGVTLMQSEAEYARLMVNGSGSVDIHYAVSGVNYTGVVTYTTTAPWPTALPGVVDGQPVSV